MIPSKTYNTPHEATRALLAYEHFPGDIWSRKVAMDSALLTIRCQKRSVFLGASELPGCKISRGLARRELQTVSRHVSCGYFCARNPGASRLRREGGEYNTLRGNKPACLWTGSEPPATSAVVRSLSGGVVQRYPEGDIMTATAISAPKTITEIEAIYSVLSATDEHSHLLMWREQMLQDIPAADIQELGVKVRFLMNLMMPDAELTMKGQEQAFDLLASIWCDVERLSCDGEAA